MRNKEIPICLISASLLAISGASVADSEDLIAECAALGQADQRITCLENAIRQLSGAMPETLVETGTATSDTAIPAPLPESPPVAATAATPVVETEIEAVDAKPVADEPPPAPVESQPEVVLGEEQIARNDDANQEAARVSARIVEHQVVGTGRLRLTLDNGQVWQQTEDDRDRIARRIRNSNDINVEMWQSRSGGYRMHLVEINRTLRVRRIR